MRVWKAAVTDAGIRKRTNQDSYCIKEADTPQGKIGMSVICDGMGGLMKGEVASGSLITAFSNWFDQKLVTLLEEWNAEVSSTENRVVNDHPQNVNALEKSIEVDWKRLIENANIKLSEFGREHGFQLGTTLTAMLFYEKQFCLAVHVGDTRIYRVTENNIELLTEDQTVMNREIKNGRLTKEQALTDPRRNVLLQCIGASAVVVPEMYHFEVKENEAYLLCTDGFRHKISEDEMLQLFRPSSLASEQMMQQHIGVLIDRDKERKECDNITAILLKIGLEVSIFTNVTGG